MKFHKLLTVTAVAGLSLSLAACGGQAKSDGSAEPGKGSVKITYLAWDPADKMQVLVDAFEKANPDVKVEIQSAENSANGYAEVLKTRIAGDQAPDVFHMSTELRGDIMKGGFVKDLTNEPFMKTADKVAKEMYSLDGKQYGMSVSAWTGVIITNKSLLKQAGVSEQVPNNLKDFIEFSNKIKDSGVSPYMEEPNVVSGSFLPMLGGYLNQKGINDNNNPIWEGKQTFTELWLPVVQQWNQLVTSGVIPKEMVGLSGDQIKQQFLSGKLAMYRSGPWDFDDIKKANIDYGVAAFPAVEGGESWVGGGPDSPFAINAKIDDAKTKAAEKFLGFVNSEEGLKIYEKELGKLITSEGFKGTVDPVLEPLVKEYLQTGKYSWANWPKKADEMAKTMSDSFQQMELGQLTPEQVTKALDEKWAN